MRGCFFFKTGNIAPWESQELPVGEKMAQNTANHYFYMSPTNIKHNNPFLGHYSINMGSMGLYWLFLRKNTPLMKNT